NRNHNIRASVQTGFRNPTTQDLFIGLNAGPYVLIGAAPSNLDRYTRDYSISAAGQIVGQPATITQTGAAAYNNSYSRKSVETFARSGYPADLAIGNPELVKPEQLPSFEVGYRGKLNNVTVD